MFFTREDILKIQQALLQLGVKDSELPSAEPVTYDDTLSIVQDGKNKQIGVKDFFNQISLWKREDFINITDRYDEHYIMLLEAINLVPVLQRKDGLVITFQDTNSDWRIYQFRGNITEFLNEEKWFDLYDYRNYIIKSFLPDEEDITALTPDENGNSFLALKDRIYDPAIFSGKGYKFIRKNIINVELATIKISVTNPTILEGDIYFNINNKGTKVHLSPTIHNTTKLVSEAIKDALVIAYNDYRVTVVNSVVTLTRKYSGSISPTTFEMYNTGVRVIVEDSTTIDERNIITQNDINKADTIYEIRYDFDLDGKTITIPKNCVLYFTSGKFYNGSINMDNTVISTLYEDILSEVNINGSYYNIQEHIKNHQRQLDDKQSQIDDKQQQITANDEDISLLQTRSTQMEETIKGIAATGGASQATAVTYDNANSQLTAVNIQSAVDELQGSKINKTSILQESGNAEDKVMSQKVVSDKLSDLSAADYDRTTFKASNIYPNDNSKWFVSDKYLSLIIPVYINNNETFIIEAGAARCLYSFLTSIPTGNETFGEAFESATTRILHVVKENTKEEVVIPRNCKSIIIVLIENGNDISPKNAFANGVNYKENITELLSKNSKQLYDIGKVLGTSDSFFINSYPNENSRWHNDGTTKSIVIPVNENDFFEIDGTSTILYSIISSEITLDDNFQANGEFSYVSKHPLINATSSGNSGKIPSGGKYLVVVTVLPNNGGKLQFNGIFINGFNYIGDVLGNLKKNSKQLSKNSELLSKNSEQLYDIGKVFTVGKSGTEDFSSLTRCIKEAVNYPHSKVFVSAGDYNIEDEFKELYGEDFFDTFNQSKNELAIFLKNNIELYFSVNSKVLFNYDGTNEDVITYFSPFNAGGSFLMDGANIFCSNCRYAVHDELVALHSPYKNVYNNCYMYKNNTKASTWRLESVLGGGLGHHGYIIIKNCVFDYEEITEGKAVSIASYHNNGGNDGESRIVVEGCYFSKKGTFRLGYHGTSEKMTQAYVSNNSLGSALQISRETPYSNVINMEYIEWNNVVR